MLHYVASDLGLHCLPMPKEIPYQLHHNIGKIPFPCSIIKRVFDSLKKQKYTTKLLKSIENNNNYNVSFQQSNLTHSAVQKTIPHLQQNLINAMGLLRLLMLLGCLYCKQYGPR